MRRAALLGAGALVFLAVSALVARWLTTENTERNAVVRLLRAQAAGDPVAMLDLLDPACRADAECRATVATDARRLARPGEPRIIAYSSSTAYALGGASGATRVAWTVVGRGLPVVQCVSVRREGTLLGGHRVVLRSISAPISGQASC